MNRSAAPGIQSLADLLIMTDPGEWITVEQIDGLAAVDIINKMTRTDQAGRPGGKRRVLDEMWLRWRSSTACSSG